MRAEERFLMFYTERGFKPGLRLIERFTTFLVALKGAIYFKVKERYFL